MTKEEAAKILKLERASWRENPKLKVAQCLCDAYDMAIKALEQQPKWIPVSERLPEKNGRYLVYIINNYYKLRGITIYEYNADGYWKWYPDNRCIADNVIAWMLLPEEYKEESEEN